jgi:hypothetical protein
MHGCSQPFYQAENTPQAGAGKVIAPKVIAPGDIAVGDRVRWNGYSGRVLTVDDNTAVVVEPGNLAFGRAVKWTLKIDALTRMDQDPC